MSGEDADMTQQQPEGAEVTGLHEPFHTDPSTDLSTHVPLTKPQLPGIAVPLAAAVAWGLSGLISLFLEWPVAGWVVLGWVFFVLFLLVTLSIFLLLINFTSILLGLVIFSLFWGCFWLSILSFILFLHLVKLFEVRGND